MKRCRNNERGSILIVVYMILAVLLVMSSLFVSRTVTERKLFDISRERAEAFYLAEAAVDRGISELNANYAYAGTASAVPLGRGEYVVAVTTVSATQKRIDATGYIPSQASPRTTRHIEAITRKYTPPNFFDKAIYSANDITLNGNSYIVNGDVIYADDLSDATHITGTTTQDPSIAPLAQFDFAILREIAVLQGNLYDAARLAQVQSHADTYPADFWYQEPTGTPPNPATGIPNVVYVEGDMVMNGNIGVIGGFFLVVGNVLTDPSGTTDTTINGNGTVDGCIYTTGSFRINGGAGNLNVNGGVWAGDEARMNGNATVSFNSDFMTSIKQLIEDNSAGGVVQLLSWREVM